MSRHPAVAGLFYPGSAGALRKQVEGFIIPGAKKVKALGILSPHAGLIYSGSVAGAVYSSIELPDTFVLIGPNHTGLGAPVSIMAKGSWETPLGTVEINSGLAAAIMSHSSRIEEDSLAHMREHSLEVQLPFIQYLKEKFTIVPIQMLDTRIQTCLEVGRAIAEAVKERREQRAEGRGKTNNKERQTSDTELPPLIIASSDMSHYESVERAREKDQRAIGRILDLDPEGLYRVVRDSSITMCGYGPAVAMLSACKALGASKAKLVKYAHSGEVSGDYAQVVGYAGVVVC